MRGIDAAGGDERRKRLPEQFDLARLAEASSGMSGAEIEAVVIEALWTAYPEDRELSQADLVSAIHATVPLSRTMSESIEALRSRARTRARPASPTTTS